MAVLVLVETPDNNRCRFIADSMDSAVLELGRQFPVGSSVAERLRKGERVVTEQYVLAVRPFETAAPPRQKTLF